MNRQICHKMTGSANTTPPYKQIRMRAEKPSSGPNENNEPSHLKSGLAEHRFLYGCVRKFLTGLYTVSIVSEATAIAKKDLMMRERSSRRCSMMGIASGVRVLESLIDLTRHS
jgi:hypothetical protein